jgi:hypothetical protein
MDLEKVLAKSNRAINHNPAWGYSPYPTVRLLLSGEVEVYTTIEGAFTVRVVDNPAAADRYLYGAEWYLGVSFVGTVQKYCLYFGKEDYKLGFEPIACFDTQEERAAYLVGHHGWVGVGEWEEL